MESRPPEFESESTRHVLIFIDRWDSAGTSEHIEAVATSFPHWRFHILQQTPKFKAGAYLRTKLRLFSRDPLTFTVRTALQLGHKLRRPRLHVESGVKPPSACREIRLPNLTYRKFENIHAPDAIEYARSLGPWLGLSIGAPILNRRLFSIPKLGTINVHKSKLPQYRGMPYGFWELHDDAQESGISIHKVDDRLDTGPIIHSRALKIPPYTTIRGLTLELDRLANVMLVEALRMIERDPELLDRLPESSRNGTGKLNRMPRWIQAYRVSRKLRARRSPMAEGAGRLKRILKSGVMALYIHLVAIPRNFVRSLGGRCRTSILLYHRVNDAFLDNVTVGVEQFEKQVDMVSRHYDVIDLPEFLSSRGKPRRRPAVVLTFDDGYEDNQLAAMVLRRYGLPCTFFISTRIVNTDRGFDHDLKALGFAVPTLTWDEIRRMRDWGFQIANHTQSHPNLGAIPSDVALAEIGGAAADLERELGPVPGRFWIAFPFGQRSNMTEELRRRLPEVGVSHCLSARGGTNPVHFEESDVLRQSVDYRFDLLRLRAAIEGWSA